MEVRASRFLLYVKMMRSFPLGKHLTILPDGCMLYRRADGKGLAFEKDGEIYRAPGGYTGILESLEALDVENVKIDKYRTCSVYYPL